MGDLNRTHPKYWTGSKTKPAKKTPKPLAEPAEKIPDEVEVLDEQTSLDTAASE